MAIIFSILGLLSIIIGGFGILWFGGSILLELLSAAKFKAENGKVPDLCKREMKGSLKLVGVSFVLFIVGALFMGLGGC